MLNGEFHLKSRFAVKMFNVLEYQKKYREAHREQSREYHRRNYRDNKEKIKKSHRLTYLKYREKIIENAKKYREQNLEKIKESRRRYWLKTGKIQNEKIRRDRIENPEKWEKVNEKRRYDRKNHPEKFVKVNQRRREQFQENREEILAYHKKLRNELKLEVMKHYSKGSPKCNKCGESEINFLVIDHIEGKKAHGHGKNFGRDKLLTWLRKNEYPNGFQVLCHTCNVIKEIRRPKTLSQKREYVLERQNRKRRKLEVFSHYSGGKPRCTCCGFTNIDGLAIDHMDGRRSSGHSQDFTSFRFYGWLIKRGYPKNYQVLCHNCNSTKGFFGICPHQQLNQKLCSVETIICHLNPSSSTNFFNLNKLPFI